MTNIRAKCVSTYLAPTKSNSSTFRCEELTVSFDVDARQWNDRWFNSIRAWKVERVGAGAPMAPGAPVPPPAPSATPDFTMGDAKDDLPF